ncbi:MAG: 4-hydroxy-tetrahydrodipicolinate synthase [Gammaproteobacteria bacterium]|nr:4-hydroxy-tetrahydrodipicolinate synthase [Gammaproteobacteria bacterium]
MFKGSMVALVTPMQADGTIHKKSLHDLVEWHIDAKTSAIIVNGTTGESPTLSKEEQEEMITSVVKQAKGRIPIIAGTGTNATHTTVAHTQFAKEAGVDACLLIAPYYNRPTQNGVYEHFKTVAEKVALPIILYNHPGRTGCDILPETIQRLADLPNIIGVKEATGKTERCVEVLKRCGTAFAVYSGDDATAYDFMLHGAHGVISVAANLIPHQMRDLCEAALSGNKALANQLNTQFMGLFNKLCLETNPTPVKWAACEMGLIPSGIRLPLLPLDTKFHSELRTALQEAGLAHTTKEV